MVKARLSEAEWEKIKQSSGIVENDGEAGHPKSDVVEPIAMPSRNPTKLGNMVEAKGGKMVGKMTEWKSHAGYDAGADKFEEKHPTLAKAVDIGKRVVGTVNKKASEYLENVEKSDKKLKEMERDDEGEEELEEMKSSKKPKSKSKSKKKSKMLDEDEFNFDDEDEDITALHRSTSKQKILPGDYKSAFGGGMGKKGYESVYTSGIGGGTYQPAYKPKVHEAPIVEMNGESKPVISHPQSRYDANNWQSLGFPNTLPMGARGALFRPVPPNPQPQQMVTPTIHQPNQPVRPQQAQMQPRAQSPIPRMGTSLFTTPTITTPRAPMPMPRMGAGLFMQPQQPIVRPRSQMVKFTPPVVPRMGSNLPRVATPNFTPSIGLRLSNSPSKRNNINTSLDASHITILGMPAFKKRK